MKSNLNVVETNLNAYLERYGDSVEIIKFRRVYLRLVLMFKEELNSEQFKGVFELQKYLLDEQFNKLMLDELERFCRQLLNQHLKNNTSLSRKALLNQLLYGALLESEETDFFYVIEPIFLFAKELNVDAAKLEEVLISEFPELSKI